MLDQFARNPDGFFVRDRRLDVRILARAVEPFHVIFDPVRFAVERSKEVGYRRAEYDAKVINREPAFGGGYKVSVEVRD